MLDQAGAGTAVRVGMQVCTMAGRCKGRAACGSWKGATTDAGARAWGWCWKREDDFHVASGVERIGQRRDLASASAPHIHLKVQGTADELRYKAALSYAGC